MLSKKSDIDRHVEECLRRINSETERNLRCFAFAKQYFKIERYEEARRYVSTYLSVKPNSAEGHYLLGKCLEKLGKKDAAVQAYTRSLNIDPKQNNLVIKVCELLASDDTQLDQSGAQHFCELAQSIDPHNPVVFSLKQRMITSQNDDPNEVSNLLLRELENRPTDVKLRVRLLKHLLQHNMIKDSYKHVSEIEMKDFPIFHHSMAWYEVVAEVLLKYQMSQMSNSLGWKFWFLSVGVLDKLTALSLDEHSENIKTSTEYIATTFNLDQTLAKATMNITDCPDKRLTEEFLNHYRAQLCFHFAVLIYKQAKKDLIKYKEASNLTLPLLFAAYNSQPPDLGSLWFMHCTEDRKLMIKRWHKEGAFRCSQAGHILTYQAKERCLSVIEKAKQFSMGMWRDHLFKKLFITRDQQLKMSSSYFLSNQQLVNIDMRVPDSKELLKFDEEAQLLYPDSLHHHIWIAMNNEFIDVTCAAFEGLQYTVKQLKNCGAETLNYLDILAFIYCSTLCARAEIENKHITQFNVDKPSVLPAAVTDRLGTVEQCAFFKAAYKMFKNEYDSDLDQVRFILIDGIKTLRCIDYSLDVKLILPLANVFVERYNNAKKFLEIEANEARAELYWKVALHSLERLKNKRIVAASNNKLFKYRGSGSDLSSVEVERNIEAGKLFMGKLMWKRKDLDKAEEIFNQLKTPYASFFQGQIYKQLAELEINEHRENVTSEMRSQNIILLSRARDCFYLTLDRLREQGVSPHSLDAELSTEIENIERALSRIDPDCNNRNECDGMSDENASSAGSAGDHYVTSYNLPNLSTTFRNSTMQPSHSTPYRSERLREISRREARPSPERLDAQLRNMTFQTDRSLFNMGENIRSIFEIQKSLKDDVEKIKDSVNNLTKKIEPMTLTNDKIREVESTVSELKATIGELDHLKTLTDMVSHLRKEIEEIKKDINKTTQLSEEDIYGLANDYGTDFNVASNLGAYNPNFYQNYQGRIPNAPPLYGAAAAPLYPGNYRMYPYGGLGLPFPGAEQQLPGAPDFRAAAAAIPPQVLPNLTYPRSTQWDPLSGQPPFGVGFLTGQGLAQGQVLFGRDPKLSDPNMAFAALPSSPASISASNQPISTSQNAPIASQTLPGNVVITTSDPLPSIKATTSQPVLSVTIPPQHIKGVAKPHAHNYQIPLPTSAATHSTSPSVLSKPAPTISTQSLLSNVAAPAFSSISPHKVNLGLHIEKKLDQSFGSTGRQDLSNISAGSLEEHDPCPDFKPIIPLPDEVPVNTGEENERVLFNERAKLYRYVNKEWKERGVGSMKILRNPQTQKVRILMRRDQVHKICANHFLTKTLQLTPKGDISFIWAAPDFADGEVVKETFCVRFKTAEEANKFKDVFDAAQKSLPDSTTTTPIKDSKTPNIVEEKVSVTPKKDVSATISLGGFKFSTTPTFKPKPEVSVTPTALPVQQETAKPSPFAGFTFGKKGASPQFPTGSFNPVATPGSPGGTGEGDGPHPDDFIPTAEFKPVVPLPELVDIKTGEENAVVLFENRAKLLRFDTAGDTKEWKERGTGTIKLIKDDTKVRLLMRRDQVHKVCLNHQVLKDMKFMPFPKNPKAVTWCAKDYADGVLKSETFSARFKEKDTADAFLKAVKDVQDSMDDSSCVGAKGDRQAEEKPVQTGFGDKFKPLKGSWECKNCYIVNDSKTNTCAACETPKAGTAPKKSDNGAGEAFSFGVAPTSSAPVSSWGSTFRPKEGSWECKSCYTRNNPGTVQCIACTIPNSGTATATAPPKKNEGVSLDTGGLKFSFGVPAAEQKAEVAKTSATGWGEAFKPKQGSWECKSCYTRNLNGVYCVSCEAPKDETVPEKKAGGLTGVNLDTPGQKFTFGLPAATTPAVDTAAKATFTFGQSSIPAAPTFSFSTESPFSFSTITGDKKEGQETSRSFVFGSPHKHDFEFTPRSPHRRISSGTKDDESDNSYFEEEADNIYFKPVIPLPDKVDVKTGEEDLEMLYSHRAKLFRYVDGEWKERGLGDIKVFKSKSNGKLRVIMRREQVLKICLNHFLTPDIKYISKDEKTWMFYAPDFSEGEVSNDKFCVRFKNEEIAQEFKNAVDDALSGASKVGESVPAPADSTTEDGEKDVEVVWETQVSPAEEKEALALKLPPKFMAYRQLPDCTCEQCKKDDEYLQTSSNRPQQSSFKSSLPSSQEKSVTFSTPLAVAPTSKGGLFGPKSESPAVATTGNETLRDLLSKPTLVVTPKEPFTSSSFGTSLGAVPKKDDSSSFKTFSFAAPPKQEGAGTGSIFGSGGSAGTPSTASSSILGAAPKGSLFGGPSATSNSGGSLFGNTTPFGSSGGSIFGSGAPKTTTGSIFGTPTPSSKPIFGGTTSVTTSTTAHVFGSSTPSTTATSAPLFGSGTTQGSIFGGSATMAPIGSPATSGTATSIFGGLSGIGGTPVSGGSIFGGQSLFGGGSSLFGKSTDKPLFGNNNVVNSATPIFGANKQSDDTSTAKSSATESLKEEDAPVLDCNTGLSFASLASEVPGNAPPAFVKKEVSESSATTPFAFLGAGAPVFGSASTAHNRSKQKQGDDADDEGEEGGHGDEEYDPHYDPIVPLPDAIVVSTGEEEETVLFNERAKLFRFDDDNKEWKERGIGQMKVLHHPTNGTYRFLLRREQVHKTVLNQRITPALELSPLSLSDKAWMWIGHNYTDEYNAFEKLAVRFKNSELALKFNSVVQTVLQNLQILAAQSDQNADATTAPGTSQETEEVPRDPCANIDLNTFVEEVVQDSLLTNEEAVDLPYHIESYGTEDVSSESLRDDEENVEEVYGDEDEDDDDDRTVMFLKRCTLFEEVNGQWQMLGMGDIQVYYDAELYASRINFCNDDGLVVSNTLIGVNTEMDRVNTSCIWRAVEWADTEFRWRKLRAVFSSEQAAEEFYLTYSEGVGYAQEFDVVDGIPQVATEE